MILRRIFLVIIPAFFCSPTLAWENGDIIFHESASRQSQVIQQVSGSRYSHMGMIIKRSGKTYVLEAVHHVRLTPIEQFIARGVDRHFVVKRLRPEHKPTRSQWARMEKLAEGWVGREYDLVFGWSDDRMYCSELVWKLYKRGARIRLGELTTFGELDLSAPATQNLIRARTDSLDLSEWVVTPEAMFNSDKLVSVSWKP